MAEVQKEKCGVLSRLVRPERKNRILTDDDTSKTDSRRLQRGPNIDELQNRLNDMKKQVIDLESERDNTIRRNTKNE